MVHTRWMGHRFSLQLTNAKRKRFLLMRPRLKQHNIKFGLLEPAKMLVTYHGKMQDFEEPEDLETFLEHLEEIRMDTHPGEQAKPTMTLCKQDRNRWEDVELSERMRWNKITKQWSDKTTRKTGSAIPLWDKYRSPLKAWETEQIAKGNCQWRDHEWDYKHLTRGKYICS